MGLFGNKVPKAVKLLRRGDVHGLIAELDRDGTPGNDAMHALMMVGEPAVPSLVFEISEPPEPPGYIWPISPRRLRSQVALSGIGAPAVPYLMDAIRERAWFTSSPESGREVQFAI